MLNLLPILAIPLGVMLGFKLLRQAAFTVREFLVLEVVMTGLLVGGFFVARSAAVADTEIWSGRVVAQDHGRQVCCHCRTRCDSCTDANGDRYRCNCRVVCAHAQDYYWSLRVSTGVHQQEPIRRPGVPGAGLADEHQALRGDAHRTDAVHVVLRLAGPQPLTSAVQTT